jgi:hypothetical protein
MFDKLPNHYHAGHSHPVLFTGAFGLTPMLSYGFRRALSSPTPCRFIPALSGDSGFPY